MKKERRQEIKEGLRRHWGAVSELTRRSKALKPNGFSRVYIEKVLKGQRENSEILALASTLLAELDAAKAEAEARIENPDLYLQPTLG